MNMRFNIYMHLFRFYIVSFFKPLDEDIFKIKIFRSLF